MRNKRYRSLPQWIGLVIAGTVISACGGGDNDSEVATGGTPTPAPTPAPVDPTAPAPNPSTPGTPTPGTPTPPAPTPPAPTPAAPTPTAPPPVSTTGASSDCLPRDIMSSANTWQLTFETTQPDGSVQTEAGTYTSQPNVNSPIGPGTRLSVDGTFESGGMTNPFMIDFFIRLNGNILEQYAADFTVNNMAGSLDLDFADPSFDLALNESRTIEKSVAGFTVDVTYTYLGQEVIQTALGNFTACKITENEQTIWYAVGNGLPLRRIDTLFGATTTSELVSASINGVPLTGN